MRERHYDCNGENNGFYNHHHTEETKKLISDVTRKRYKEHPEIYANRKPLSDERKKQIGKEHSKSVYVFDMLMNFIGEYESVKKAADDLGITRRVAETIVNHVRKVDKDYIIRFTSEIDSIENFSENI